MKVIELYECDHCGRQSSSKATIELHELLCVFNPLNLATGGLIPVGSLKSEDTIYSRCCRVGV